jgi:hypothetical protein
MLAKELGCRKGVDAARMWRLASGRCSAGSGHPLKVMIQPVDAADKQAQGEKQALSP